jgi:peptide/nickel transport system substrate-binding protein
MTLAYRIFISSPLKIVLAALAISFTFCVVPANAASEPGTITLVLAQEPVDLDPNNNTRNIEGSVLMRNIVETLTERNPVDSSIMPRLATSWKQIDANTWHFVLRPGVKFHDGKDFNADAAIFSVKRLYDKKIISTTRDKFFAGFKMDCKALDNLTLEIKTDQFQPLLPALMGLMAMCSPSMPDKASRQPVGTGPYKLTKWDAGTQIILERFDGYWGKQAQVKKAIYVWRKESAVRASMVLIGEADLAQEIAVQDANRPDMDYSYLNAETTQLRIGGEWEPPLNDRRFRLALNYAVDRNGMRGSIFSKDVVLATQLVGPGILGYNPDLKPWPYDPQKAKQLLDEARRDGVPVDREILLLGRTGYFPGGEELMEAVLTMYKAVGLNVKLKMLEVGVWRTYQNKPFPKNVGPYLLLRSHDNNKGDAMFTGFYSYHCKGDISSMCDKTVDELIEKAQVALGEERRSLWQAAFKRIHEEVITDVALFHMVGYARIGKRINFKPSMATTSEVQLAQITFK